MALKDKLTVCLREAKSAVAGRGTRADGVLVILWL